MFTSRLRLPLPQLTGSGTEVTAAKIAAVQGQRLIRFGRLLRAFLKHCKLRWCAQKHPLGR